MKRFEFRLQRVLDYREALESWAKDAYLEARATRLVAEQEFEHIDDRRKKLCQSIVETLEDRKTIERMFQKYDDDEAQQRTIVEILVQEEDVKRSDWIVKKQEVDTLQKLREEEHETWRYEANREEQKELDEFATMRRTA